MFYAKSRGIKDKMKYRIFVAGIQQRPALAVRMPRDFSYVHAAV